MTNEELKKKIVEILNDVTTEPMIYKGRYLGDTQMSELKINAIADALIAAGIGDIREAEHRAKTLERAFRDSLAEYLTAVNEANSYDCGIPEMFGRYANVLPYEDKVTNLLNKYLQQAEKELAEEGKND